jgi:[ribosomal protein S5]-alanine N-acetyltransferase
MSLKEAFAKFPDLETPRVKLRRIAVKDISKLLELYQDPEVVQFLDWSGSQTEQEIRLVVSFFEQQHRRGKALRWALADPHTDELIGTVVLMNFRKELVADIGYDLHKDYWGKGIMTEVLLEVIRFADRLGLKRLQAYVRPENIASAKLLEKLGFDQEGLLRKAGYHETRHELMDVFLYARVADNS